MAPLMQDDFDFVGTISDNEEILDEEQSPPPPSKDNKRKRDNPKKQNAVKKQKKESSFENVDHRTLHEEEKDSDVDSEFEFGLEDPTVALDDLDGWAGNELGAESKKAVDIDSIVARRKKNAAPAADESESDSEEEEDLADGSDEDEDAFGAGADMEDGAEDSDEGSEQDSEDELNAVDEDEVRQRKHNREDSAEQESEPASDEEDPAEARRRNEFFAPEARAASISQSGVSFQSLSLSRPILKGLAEMRFSIPTPIQAKTIPVALEGKDVVGGAVTGSGKTAAFMIPILERLLFRPKRTPTTRVVILMPTRELALQCFNVAKKLASHTDITFGQAIGGLNSREQERQLKTRPDIVIATPGRFIDLERNSASFAVNTIEILVLDEADRMLQEGFADELNEILTKIPKSRQTMLFSATMTSKVDDLIRVGLQRPVRIMVDSQKSTVSGLVQEFIRLRPGRDQKRLGYLLYLCTQVYTERVIIFFRQKKEAHRVRVIFALCDVQAAELHGSMTQQQRLDAIEAFRTGKAKFLLATDLASRGLDIKGIDTVINYEAPQSHEIYLHRVGRTARAGRTGRSCTLAGEPDRRVVKAAVKAAKTQGAQIRQRTVDPKDADAWHEKCEALNDEVEEILREEREERALASTERDLTRADNIVTHKDEILSRPKKTWFESESDKLAAKRKGAAMLNGTDEGDSTGRKKEKRKLSNKQKKKLQDRDDRKAGLEWKKGKSERGGAGRSKSGPSGVKGKNGKAGQKAGKPRRK